MKISKIKINAYGNLENKNIELKDGINLIQGENESGKSTLQSYLVNMFYGISKNKDGKSISDFEKYKPWNNDEFSGRVSYSLDNKEKYEVFRDFTKKNPTIYNENLEDISSKFDVDKKDGSKFFMEQTGIDKQMYLSTVVAMQQEVRLDEKNQNMLVQKIANLAGTGEDNVFYKKAMTELQNKIRDEIGTSKTSQKPLNILNDNLNKVQEEISKLKPYKNKKYEIEQEKVQINSEIEKTIIKQKLVDEILEQTNINIESKQKIEISNNNKKENDIKLENLHLEQQKIQREKGEIELNLQSAEKEQARIEEEIKKLNDELVQKNNINTNKIKIEENKSHNIIYIVAIVILLIGLIASITMLHNNILTGILAVLELAVIGTLIVKNNKNKKIENKRLEEEKKIQEEQQNVIKNIEDKKIELEEKNSTLLQKIKEYTEQKNEKTSNEAMIKGQIILLEKNNETIKSEIEKVSENINQQSNNIKQQLIEKYQGKIEKNELEKVINSQNIKEQKIFISEALNELKIKLKGLEIEENNVIPHVDNLVSLEEKEELYKEKINELKQKEEIINICLVNLSEAYEEMKTTITPKFTQNLSSSIEKISNAKYNKVTINDENGMIVENERGEYISADKLSTGTIDQLYLSLRLSMIEEISKEKLPIILDETFAYFDENRLEQALQYLSNNLRKHQAIIFTCSNREKEILNKLNIEYNLVEL